jgi:beta-glucosidase
MKQIKKLTCALALALLSQNVFVHAQAPQLGKSVVKDVIAAMSLEEKAWLVVGNGMYMEFPDSILRMFPGGKNPFAVREDGNPVYNAMIKKAWQIVPGVAGSTAGIERLNIPATVVSDGPAGVRIAPIRKNDNNTYYCTAFPIASLLASTWDKKLVYELGQSYGQEVKDYNIDVLLGPGMNIQRNPLCGRNFEYYSEDPLVTGKMAAAMVNGIQSQGVGTSIKHFAANNQETNRNTVNTIVSERALREIYLEGFRIAVQESRPWTVMSSYNKINGVYTSESYDLLTKILRNDWGYNGYVMTDWGGGKDIVAQMKAGNNLIMPGSPDQVKQIMDAVNSGKLDINMLNKNVEEILNIVLLTPKMKDYQASNKPDLKAHAEAVRKTAAEGMVLLKNNKAVLPLASDIKKIAAFGNGSYEVVIGGTGSGDVNEAYSINPADGYVMAGYNIDYKLINLYSTYIRQEKANHKHKGNIIAEMMGAKPLVDEMPVTISLAKQMAETNDVALVVIRRNAGEGEDRNIEGDFTLKPVEKEMIKNVSQAFHAKGKKVVVILNIGGVIETSSWCDLPDAIMLAWQPGQEAGNSIADVLSGKVTPSGKLAITFPVSYKDVPSSATFPGVEVPLEPGQVQEPSAFGMMPAKPWKMVYNEGIYVGYRYYNSFKIKPAYEFGYGLSYTNFTYRNLKLNNTTFSDKIAVSIDIQNNGKVAGKEVVELYLSAPANKLDKPESELKGFEKTALLKPGESQTVMFELDKRSLASFDTNTSSWIAEAGNYTVKVGASSKDIRQSATFSLPAELMVKQESKALQPQETINELKNKQ